jgi:hypothetical protein
LRLDSFALRPIGKKRRHASRGWTLTPRTLIS